LNRFRMSLDRTFRLTGDVWVSGLIRGLFVESGHQLG
jgi:hypothetical protein